MSALVSPNNPAPLRLAIVSTPRSGSTWLRHLLSRIWSLPQVAVHELADDAWASLPSECVLQLHWHRQPAFERRLEAEGFRVITIARHPFDILISLLHVAVYGVESEHWLGGLHGDESSLWGAMPCSRAFIEYAAGPRAAVLFQVTNEWWHAPGVISLRYEDLVRDPRAILRSLEPLLGPPRLESIETAIQETSLRKLRLSTGHSQHFWQGRPGLWRDLIPAEHAQEMATALQSTFSALNYECDPDPALTVSMADRNWAQFFGRELRTTLDRNTELHRSQLDETNRRLVESDLAKQNFEASYLGAVHLMKIAASQRDDAYQLLEAQQPLIVEATARLPLIEGCGRFSLRAARFVQACMNRMARLRRLGRRSRPEASVSGTSCRETNTITPQHLTVTAEIQP